MAFRKSTKRNQPRRASSSRRTPTARRRAGPPDSSSAGVSSRAHADADAGASRPPRPARAGRGSVEVGAVVADVERVVEVGVAQQPVDPRPLSSSTGGRTSSTLRPQWIAEPASSARSATSFARRLAPPPRRPRRASGRRRSAPCPRAHAQAVQPVRPRRSANWSRGAARRRPRGRARAAVPAAQELGAVVAEVGDRAERDDPARRRRAAAAHAGDAAVAPRDWRSADARGLGDLRVVGVADDRRERPVDVEQDRRRRGRRAAKPAPRAPR